jgi:hypothetical protein
MDIKSTKEWWNEICIAGAVTPDGAATLVHTVDNLIAEVEQLKEAARHQSDHPQKCPITGRDFFMVIEHPERGDVATYGGPFDSYTIPERDNDGMLCCERYDHDAGHWADGGEMVGLVVVAEKDILRACDECDGDGWVQNRVEGRGACTCMIEAEPFQILLKALEKIADPDAAWSGIGCAMEALDALRAVLPLDYANGVKTV